MFGNTVGGNRTGPLVRIVGVGGGAGCSVDVLHQRRQLVQIIISITNTMGIAAAGLYILHHPVGQVIVVSCGDTRCGVRHCGQCAAVIVAVGDGVAVFVGLLGNTTLDIVGILYTIAIAVAIPPGSLTATHLPLHKGGLRERADVTQLATTNVNGGSAINDRWIVY